MHHDVKAVGALTKQVKHVRLSTTFGVGLKVTVTDGRRLRMDSSIHVVVLTPCCNADADYKPPGRPGFAWHGKANRGHWRCKGCRRETLPELETMDEIWLTPLGGDPLELTPHLYLWVRALERFAIEYGPMDILRAAMVVQDCLGRVEEELLKPWDGQKCELPLLLA